MDQQQLNGSAPSEASTVTAPTIPPAQNNTTTTPPFPPLPLLTLETCTVRPWHPSDAESASRHADDRLIAQWMTNMFPHPYTLEKAHEWIAMNQPTSSSPPSSSPPNPDPHVPAWPALLNHAIALPSGECVGGIGLKPGRDVHARSAEVGYWIGAAAWGRGIATDALAAYAAAAFAACPPLERLDARIYAGNAASARVLEKCGFLREGVRRRAVWKWGEWRDEEDWGLLRAEWEERAGREA